MIRTLIADKMAAVMVMKRNMDEKARRKAFDAIFKRFDFNHNGKLQEEFFGKEKYYLIHRKAFHQGLCG